MRSPSDVNVKELCELIKSGLPVESSVALAGIHPFEFSAWMTWGRDPGGRPEFHDFALKVDKARASRVQTYIQSIWSASDGDWKAASWLLERLEPALFARKTGPMAVEEVPEMDNESEFDIASLTHEEYDKIIMYQTEGVNSREESDEYRALVNKVNGVAGKD